MSISDETSKVVSPDEATPEEIERIMSEQMLGEECQPLSQSPFEDLSSFQIKPEKPSGEEKKYEEEKNVYWPLKRAVICTRYASRGFCLAYSLEEDIEMLIHINRHCELAPTPRGPELLGGKLNTWQGKLTPKIKSIVYYNTYHKSNSSDEKNSFFAERWCTEDEYKTGLYYSLRMAKMKD